VELLASIRPRSVAVSFNFLVFDEVVGGVASFRFASAATLVLLLGPGGFPSRGNSCPSDEILYRLLAQNLTKSIRASLEQ
jgi:hypothetical protein